MKNLKAKKMMKTLCIVAVMTILLSMMTGCAKKSDSASTGSQPSGKNYDISNSTIQGNGNGAAEAKTAATVENTTAKDKDAAANRKSGDFGGHKIIQTGEIFLETLTFDESNKKLTSYVESIGGFIQNEDVQGKGSSYAKEPVLRAGSYIFRIPSSKFASFFTKAGDFGSVRNQARHGEDITDQYTDTETKVVTLKIRQERLQNLMKKATKLADIIELEKELQDVAYEIDSLTGSLKKWDSLVEFSTITVNIQEVAEVTVDNPSGKEPLGERMLFGLKDSLKSLWDCTQALLIILMYLLPYGIIVGIFVFVGFRVTRIMKRNKKDEKTNQSVKPNNDIGKTE